MKAHGHRTMTTEAFDLVHTLEGDHPLLSASFRDAVVEATPATDGFDDLEFVDVESAVLWGTGRDDPHADDSWVSAISEDQARYRPWGYNTTAFDHFLDVRKGSGQFDDYDGYSYQHGSARVEQHQTVDDYLQNDAPTDTYGLPGLIATVLRLSGKTSWKVDEALNWWFNDEYVHVPGDPWYRGCSPAVERYSYPADTGRYGSLAEEAVARFPLAESRGGTGRGIPYSVFMPVDNLARYWYNDFVRSRAPMALGAVFHAIGDASIPHHAAGLCGNWHTRFERSVDANAETYYNHWMPSALWMLNAMDRTDANPPTVLTPDNLGHVGNNWSINLLVTRVALCAYRYYRDAYHGFSGGFTFSWLAHAGLWLQGVVTCAHVLRNLVRRFNTDVFSDLIGLSRLGGTLIKAPEPLRTAESAVTKTEKELADVLLRGEILEERLASAML